jgi:hypothetical protein
VVDEPLLLLTHVIAHDAVFDHGRIGREMEGQIVPDAKRGQMGGAFRGRPFSLSASAVIVGNSHSGQEAFAEARRKWRYVGAAAELLKDLVGTLAVLQKDVSLVGNHTGKIRVADGAIVAHLVKDAFPRRDGQMLVKRYWQSV